MRRSLSLASIVVSVTAFVAPAAPASAQAAPSLLALPLVRPLAPLALPLSPARACQRWRCGSVAARPRTAAARMSEAEPADSGKLQLYPSRWIMLGYLSLLALLSDWVCFSVAAAPETWVSTFDHDPATLIDIFLFTNVAFCFLEPAIVRRLGLRGVVTGAAALMSAGCLLRSGVPLVGGLPEYTQVVAGTVLVGAAQPFFQCTPPLLSATWFGADERALATAIAINFNQVGIATAFLVGGVMAQSADGLAQYFDLITGLCFAVTAGACVQFQERPPTPPSSSAAARLAAPEEPEVNFLITARQLLATPGFLPPLAAFVASIGISNVVSAFVDETLVGAGFEQQATIDLAGAGFQAAIVLGGIFLGGFVDRSKRYKQVTMFCLAGTLITLVPLGLPDVPRPVVIAALLSLGALAGPVQPINAELAVEVSYPADENAIEALQQLCGNLFSALLVPLAERASTVDLTVPGGLAAAKGDTVLLCVIAASALAYYSSFDAPLRRSALDCAGTGGAEVSGCEAVFEGGSAEPFAESEAAAEQAE